MSITATLPDVEAVDAVIDLRIRWSLKLLADSDRCYTLEEIRELVIEHGFFDITEGWNCVLGILYGSYQDGRHYLGINTIQCRTIYAFEGPDPLAGTMPRSDVEFYWARLQAGWDRVLDMPEGFGK